MLTTTGVIDPKSNAPVTDSDVTGNRFFSIILIDFRTNRFLSLSSTRALDSL